MVSWGYSKRSSGSTLNYDDAEQCWLFSDNSGVFASRTTYIGVRTTLHTSINYHCISRRYFTIWWLTLTWTISGTTVSRVLVMIWKLYMSSCLMILAPMYVNMDITWCSTTSCEHRSKTGYKLKFGWKAYHSFYMCFVWPNITEKN